MNKSTRKTPEIRFKGFSEAWEQRKLGAIGELKNGMNFDQNAMGHGYPFVNLQDVFGKNIVDSSSLGFAESSEKQRQEYSLKKGDILFVRSSIKREGVGEAVLVPKDLKDTTYSGFIIRYRPIVKIDDEFKRFIFGTRSIRNQILSRATSSANTNINQGSLEKVTIKIPLYREQKSIGNFFKQLDSTIALHQRKLELLKQLKLGYLQNVFPQQGESVPKLRFTNFASIWEQRKLGEVANIIAGGTPSTNILEYWGGDIDWYSPIEISHNMYATGSKRKITKLGLNKSSAKILPAHKTILFTSRAGIGDMAILKRDGSTNQGFQSLVVNDENDVYFLYYLGDKIKQFALKHAAGSTFLEISGKELKTMKLLIPTLQEQKKIGIFLKLLDNTITKHQSKLDKLETLKKAYLQKVFI